MTPQPSPNNAPVVIIDNFYSADELCLIWKELDFLTSPIRMFPPHILAGATYDDGSPKKTSSGVFLDSFYTQRQFSDILTLNRKIFSPEVKDHALTVSPFYAALQGINNDATLVNYYEDAQQYAAHVDETVFTAITMLNREPCQFTGGELIFPDMGVTIEHKNNRLVIFAGYFSHAIAPVRMNAPMASLNGFGRYGLTQFLCIK